MKKIRKLPTVLGMMAVVASLFAGVLAIRQGSGWFLQAEPEKAPKEVKITNVTDNSFSVSWVTDSQTSGFLSYGPAKSLSFTAVDDRDQENGTAQKYFTHYVSLKNLQPATDYFFEINTDNKTHDDDGQPFQVTTGPMIQGPPPPSDVAYGTVVKASGSPAEGAIVYLSLANTTPLSSLTKSSGNWMIPLNLARTDNLTAYVTYDKEASIENFMVQAGPEGTAVAVAVTAYDSPLPTITLGQNHDFRKPLAEDSRSPSGAGGSSESPPTTLPTTPPTISPTVSPPASKFSFEETATPSGETRDLAIINPDQGEKINTQKPAILGTAPAGESLTISVESPAPQSEKIIVDSQGNWEWSPKEDLEPGEHTITASYTDDEGQIHRITQQFVVLAAADDSLPSIESTPSGIATPTATPTTPATRAAQPSTAGGVPKPGHWTPTFFLTLVGIFLIGFGFIGFRQNKKNWLTLD